jgi:predicted ATPase/class 3 adenylate cyclase
MTEEQQIEAGITALEAQRAVLGDVVVDTAAAPLRARLELLRKQRDAAQQQLRQVSVLFVDTVGSTAMAQRLDPEDVHAVMDGSLQRYTAVVERFGGRVMQYTGDGLLAAFGADGAHEDDAERAVRAGLQILAEAAGLSAEIERIHAVAAFNVRVGVATGNVLLGGGVDAEGNIRGNVVNMAARMEQTAPPGALRIHGDTYRHVRGVFQVAQQPPLLVKGQDEPLVTYLVLGSKPRAFRVVTRGIEGVETRMVAREFELEQLQQAFATLSREPRLQLVHIVGEAGLGKSRLLYEFENWAEAQPQAFIWFRGRAEPQTERQPFGLLRRMLAWRLQIGDDDDTETARRKLLQGVVPLFASDGEAQAHLLGHLIGLDFSASPHLQGILDDARQVRNRAFHAAAQLLRLAAARRQAPPLLVLDDLHWADDGSLDFLVYLTQALADQPLLMLCLTRQTLFERRADWALLAESRARIELQPLDKRGSRELAGVLLQRLETVPAALRDLVIAGAEGNPFYMEELVRMLIDDGAIVTGGERWHVVADKLLAAHVPPTLTGVLQARLDGLPAAEKRALQQAAVIGFVFWDSALATLDAGSVTTLASLVKRGLIVNHEHAAFDGQREYAFKHLILHQVTYESVLKRERRELHARVAGWLALLGGDRGTETLGSAAEHYDRAGDAANARALYLRAAEAAAARFANDAMLVFVERALALTAGDDHATRWRLLAVRERHRLSQSDRAAHAADLDALQALAEALDDDERRIAVALRRAAALRAAGDYVAAEAAVRSGLALAHRPGAGAHAVALQNSLADTLIGRGRYELAREAATQGLQRAREGGDRVGESNLINALGLIAMEQGDLVVAAEHFERTLRMVREIGNRSDEALRLSNLGSVYPRLGDYARARDALEQGLQLARDTGRRDNEAVLLLNTASVAHLQGDEAGALTYANAAHASALASGQRDLEAFARLVAGHAELGLGRLDSARAAYSDSRELLEQLKMRRQQVLDPVSGLARVALAAGDITLALQHAELLLAHMAEGGNFDGTEEPLLLPLTCWQVLHAAADARAAAVLDAAMAELQAQAERIQDAQARRAFLEVVPHHREIAAAWQRERADRR